jgi:hypothetical protein
MSFTTVTACRSCSGDELLPVLDLGEQPLANDYRRRDDTSAEPRYPLALVMCPACSLVQLTGTVPPTQIFDDYPYFSSYSATVVDSARALAERVLAEHDLTADDLVVEVASNDGYLLKHYVEHGVAVVGIEPAGNIAAVAEREGVPTVVEYFGTATAQRVRASHGPAKVMHANNVMAHVPDINDFTAGLAILLDQEGVAYVESPYLGDFIRHVEFDTTYHEHVYYYSLTALSRLVERHGLVVADIERLPIHGGTLRYSLRHTGSDVSESVRALLAEELRDDISGPGYYRDFADRVGALRRDVVGLLSRLKSESAVIYGYGAAAKGTVLLNHFDIGPDLVDVVVDRSPHKQGRRMPGVAIPIDAPDRLLQDQPDYVLLLVWNIADEVLSQESDYRQRGGRFIIPVPELRVV